MSEAPRGAQRAASDGAREQRTPTTSARDALLATPARSLRQALEHGHSVDPAALDDTVYLGHSLAQPSLIERFTWRTFVKTFHRRPDGSLGGWNVRLHQDGDDAPPRPQLDRYGRPRCFGYYDVTPADLLPPPWDRGLAIAYGGPQEPALSPLRRVIDPLVAVHAGSVDLLLGVSCLRLAGTWILPTWFLLERTDEPLAAFGGP